MFYIRYLTMHKVHMYAGAIRQLLYGCAYVREIIHSLKLADYLPVHRQKPYKNLHLLSSQDLQARTKIYFKCKLMYGLCVYTGR